MIAEPTSAASAENIPTLIPLSDRKTAGWCRRCSVFKACGHSHAHHYAKLQLGDDIAIRWLGNCGETLMSFSNTTAVVRLMPSTRKRRMA